MVAETHPSPGTCRFEMAEGQASVLTRKKLKLSLGKERWFNTCSSMEIQDTCKGYMVHNTQRSMQWVLCVFRTLLYCVLKICSFYLFVSWGDNSYQLRNLGEISYQFSLRSFGYLCNKYIYNYIYINYIFVAQCGRHQKRRSFNNFHNTNGWKL